MEKFLMNKKENYSSIIVNPTDSALMEKKTEEELVIESTLNKLTLIGNNILYGEISILNSTKEMGVLVNDTIAGVVTYLTNELQLDTDNLPFAIFLFGSPSRNLMLPNSDLDIGFVFTDDCSENVKVLLKEKIKGLPFDEIDIVKWSSIKEMQKENCIDMIDYSKATDAKFIIGNNDLSQKYIELIRNKDTEEDKINRFITEFGLFHKHDYLIKRTEKGPNLKYDFGASRDIIFLDWFYIINSSNEERGIEKLPYFNKCLDILLERNIVSIQEYDLLKSSIDIILLVKFTLRSKYIKTKDDTLLRLNSYSLHECYFEAKPAFQKLGINSADELTDAYYNAKLSLDNLVEELYNKVSTSNPALTEVWNIAKTATELDPQVLKILEINTWYELLPFAVSSKSPEILEFITDRISNSVGYEYILRIIGENKFINDKIRNKLLNSRLSDKFKKKLTL